MKCKLAFYFSIFMSGMYANAQPKPTATLIITNAAVYTVDKQHPAAEAVAIIGDRWDETKWPKQKLPTKELVDGVTGSAPIFVERYDGHEALANSAAMKLARVNAKTKDVPGGVIVRNASGNPTGIFKDAAEELIYKAIPPISHEQRVRVARRALEHAASLGVTSVQHM